MSDTLSVALRIYNDGFARAYNPRPVQLVIDGPIRHIAEVDADPRRWPPGETTEICLAFDLPGSLPAGQYRIGLYLPDTDPKLSSDARFSIRISSGATWDEASGINWLDASFSVAD